MRRRRFSEPRIDVAAAAEAAAAASQPPPASVRQRFVESYTNASLRQQQVCLAFLLVVFAGGTAALGYTYWDANYVVTIMVAAGLSAVRAAAIEP